jgi:hypothetical protein
MNKLILQLLVVCFLSSVVVPSYADKKEGKEGRADKGGKKDKGDKKDKDDEGNSAWSSCSSAYANSLVSNEINVSKSSGSSGDGYIELYTKAPIILGGKTISYSDDGKKNSVTVALDNAAVRVYSEETDVSASYYNSNLVPAGSFIVFPEALFGGKNALGKNYGEILIQESGSSSVIHYFRYGVSLGRKSQLWHVDNACSASYERNNASDNDICTKPDGSNGWQVCDATKGGNNKGEGTVASHFNCVERGTDELAGKLYTKTTAQSFAFDIVALDATNKQETQFADLTDHTVTVELVDASNDGLCASYPSISMGGVTFTASDLGRVNSKLMASSAAYSNVKCRITDTTDELTVSGCSTDSFVIRPVGFSIVTSNMNNASTGAGITAKAGRDSFTITASTETMGYNGTPKINSTLYDHNNTAQVNKLSGVFTTTDKSIGKSVGSNFKYDEVGLVTFAANDIYDDSFTSSDQLNADCIVGSFANHLVNGKVGCNFGYNAAFTIGRFIPDHFDVVLNAPEFSTANSTFTYIGQPVMYTTAPVAILTAKNALGVTTENYTGSYWKVNPTDTSFGITPIYTEANHALMIIDNGAPAAIDGGDGSGTLRFSDTSSAILAVTKSALTAPFNAEIALSFTLVDTDGVEVVNVNGLPQANPIVFGAPSAGNGISFSGTKEQRWGRIALDNAYGSELMPLTVPLSIEYYDGHNFIKNFADNSTVINLSTQLSLNNGSTIKAGNQTIPIGTAGATTATLTHIPFSGGDAGLEFSAANAYGYVDLSLLNTIDSWLLFDWDGNGVHDNLPTARVNFGLYKGNEKQIYFREIY